MMTFGFLGQDIAIETQSETLTNVNDHDVVFHLNRQSVSETGVVVDGNDKSLMVTNKEDNLHEGTNDVDRSNDDCDDGYWKKMEQQYSIYYQ